MMSGNGDFSYQHDDQFYLKDSFQDQQPLFYGSSSLQKYSAGFSDDSYQNFEEYAVYDGLLPRGYHLSAEILGSGDDVKMEDKTLVDAIITGMGTTTSVAGTSSSAAAGLYLGGVSGSATPNSPMYSSSNDAAAEDDAGRVIKEEEQQQEKDCGDANDKSKKVCSKAKKKAEKRERQPRVAFLTKSDVDHLEDGYRWRKYGQKAVKNSPHPRSYYRCTTHNCPVKKRVERLFGNPSTVMTTYEGHHTHQCPVTRRGNSSLFRHQNALLHPQLYSQQNVVNHGVFLQTNDTSASTLPQQQPLEFSYDFGLLEDVVPTSLQN